MSATTEKQISFLIKKISSTVRDISTLKTFLVLNAGEQTHLNQPENMYLQQKLKSYNMTESYYPSIKKKLFTYWSKTGADKLKKKEENPSSSSPSQTVCTLREVHEGLSVWEHKSWRKRGSVRGLCTAQTSRERIIRGRE